MHIQYYISIRYGEYNALNVRVRIFFFRQGKNIIWNIREVQLKTKLIDLFSRVYILKVTKKDKMEGN